ncbi:PDZ domain-containing protein, partial [Staphylococcus aureus]
MMWRTTTLGIEGEALRGQLAEYFGVKEGVLVRSVMKETPAEKAGLKAGDVIVKVGDTKVVSPADISSALRAVKAKSTVPVVVIRDRKEVILQ